MFDSILLCTHALCLPAAAAIYGTFDRTFDGEGMHKAPTSHEFAKKKW
jgi:hypothetical protein